MTLGKSLSYMALAQVSSFLIQFASTVILARYLTPYETGIYAVALAIIGVLSLVQAFGLQALIVREEVLTAEVSATAFTINAITAIILCLAILATSVVGGHFLHDGGVQRVLLVLSIRPIFEIFTFLPGANLERDGRFKEIALIGTASAILGTVVTIILVIYGASFMSIAYGQCAGGASGAILMTYAGRRFASFRVGFKAWRRVGDFGLQMLAVSGISAVSTRLSDVAVGRLLGLSELGIYNRASGLNGLIWNNVHLVIGRVVFVDYADLYRRGISLRPRYIRTVEVVTATLWPAFAGMAVLAKPFIAVVYGAIWVPAALPLSLLAVASMIQVSITMTWELFAATGELRTQTRIEFIRAILALLTFVGGCLISLEAAAAARIVDAIFALFLYRPYLNRMTDTRLSDFYAIYSRSLLLTLLAILPAGVLSLMSTNVAALPSVQLGGAVVIGMLFWGSGLVLMRHPIVAEMNNLLGPVLRKISQPS